MFCTTDPRFVMTSLSTNAIAQSMTLPSPNYLRRKILVKVKGKALGQPEEILPALSKVKTEDSLSSADEETPKDSKTDKPKASKIVDSLSSLGIYTRAYHFKKLDCPEASLPAHVFSLSERKVMTVHETDSSALFRHNRRFLMRAFPAGTRVTSTNLDPAVFWRKGIQMVALNWQKPDAVSLYIMHDFSCPVAGNTRLLVAGTCMDQVNQHAGRLTETTGYHAEQSYVFRLERLGLET